MPSPGTLRKTFTHAVTIKLCSDGARRASTWARRGKERAAVLLLWPGLCLPDNHVWTCRCVPWTALSMTFTASLLLAEARSRRASAAAARSCLLLHAQMVSVCCLSPSQTLSMGCKKGSRKHVALVQAPSSSSTATGGSKRRQKPTVGPSCACAGAQMVSCSCLSQTTAGALAVFEWMDGMSLRLTPVLAPHTHTHTHLCMQAMRLQHQERTAR